MGLRVYRDAPDGPLLVGSFEDTGQGVLFRYDDTYVHRADANEEQGISETMPPDLVPYPAEEYAPFFSGLLPEGHVLANLSQMYQVPRSDFLGYLGHLGCESIGALTFVADGHDLSDHVPSYEPLSEEEIDGLKNAPERMVTLMTDDMRLSLAGAQTKVAWYLPPEKEHEGAALESWWVPRGTAPSTHIVKIAAQGSERLAVNEHICMSIAERCGFSVPGTVLIEDLPGALAVKRYDRIRLASASYPLRLHQEDFCQAMGLPVMYKYADAHPEVDYVREMGALVERVSSDPLEDKRELAKRLLFHYAIGNADNHLKNHAFIYDLAWRERRLAPLYDVTCIPLTGYSTKMSFAYGSHRILEDITMEDLEDVCDMLGQPRSARVGIAKDILKGFEGSGAHGWLNDAVADEAKKVLENCRPRLDVLWRMVERS